jgi:crotonobetainyl-CoA:carnitine CoA-transferase CaiB-like acyl-CoA transferase
MSRALAGLQVIAREPAAAAPYCTRHLADGGMVNVELHR